MSKGLVVSLFLSQSEFSVLNHLKQIFPGDPNVEHLYLGNFVFISLKLYLNGLENVG